MPARRPLRPLRVTLPAELGVRLDAEAARTGAPVATVAATLLAEGVALYRAHLRRLRRVGPPAGRRR